MGRLDFRQLKIRPTVEITDDTNSLTTSIFILMSRRKKQIESKPTTYRNILFRSRLEARMAVTLDNSPNVMKWEFEPCTFTLSPQNWMYTPDFRVECFLRGNKSIVFLEIKPTMPTDEYSHILCGMAKTIRYPLILIIPDFYQMFFTAYVPCKKKWVPIDLSTFFSEYSHAFTMGANFRFDLRTA